MTSNPSRTEPATDGAPKTASLHRTMRSGQPVLRVLLKLVTTLLAISVAVYGLVALAGNPAHDILGQDATDAQVQAFTAIHHLDEPFLTRYGGWLGGLPRGDLGDSYVSNGSVWALIEPRLGRTLFLVVSAWLLIVLVSVPLGLFIGAKLRGSVDTISTLVTLAFAALPEFVVGLILIVIFAVSLQWLPADSTAVSTGGLFDSPEAYVLPVLTIASGSIPYVVRLMRANAREVAGSTYVRAALLRGVGEPSLTFRHILPNAAPPVVAALGLQLAALVGGVIVVESLFGFPGLGQLVVQSASSRDAPVVEALTMMVGTAFVVINLTADALVRVLNPRLRDPS